MRIGRRVMVGLELSLVAALASLAGGPVEGASAAPKALSGTAAGNARGYTLIALGTNGRAKSVVLGRAFKLVPPPES